MRYAHEFVAQGAVELGRMLAGAPRRTRPRVRVSHEGNVEDAAEDVGYRMITRPMGVPRRTTITTTTLCKFTVTIVARPSPSKNAAATAAATATTLNTFKTSLQALRSLGVLFCCESITIRSTDRVNKWSPHARTRCCRGFCTVVFAFLCALS